MNSPSFSMCDFLSSPIGISQPSNTKSSTKQWQHSRRRHFVRIHTNRLSPVSSSSSLHLRQCYLFWVISVAVTSAEYCTLCPGGEQITRPDKSLDFQGRLEIYNCTALDEFATSLSADSNECSDLRVISPICGCPMHVTGCSLCSDGSAITNPEKRLPYPEDILGDLVPPTCAFFEAALNQAAATSNDCKGAQLINTLCGCPIPEDACVFCPDGNIPTPQKVISGLFSVDSVPATCETVEAIIYNSIESGTSECREVEVYNYICGCNGGGHKRWALLAWLPRISAILSILGSSFIIQHVLKDRRRRRVPYHQLVLGMSHFDLISSIWWSLSTLPMPAVDENGDPTFIYGARGNEASCTAQGWFIQLGLTSPFFNLSLALYYLLVVSFGWSELKIKKVIGWMQVVPVLSGLGLAFGGIPFYGQRGAPSFCYIEDGANKRNSIIFLVVPISISIVFATLAMAMLFWSVYRRERASSRWASKEGTKLSRKVFWQAFWYLTSFYVSWPVLIIVQFVDANLYTSYWFQCLTMFLSPIQGFLNFIVYIRPRAQLSMDNKKCCSCFSVGCLSPKPSQETHMAANSKQENELSSVDSIDPSARILQLHAGSAVLGVGESGNFETSTAENAIAHIAIERSFADESAEYSLTSDHSARVARCT